MSVHEALAEIEEVSTVLTPAPGVTIDQALEDAALVLPPGATIKVFSDHAVITWFKRSGD